MHSWRYPQHFNRDVMLANQPQQRLGEDLITGL